MSDPTLQDRLRNNHHDHADQICHEAADRIDELEAICRNVYEVWAGSEGIPMPKTCGEAYLLQLVEQMRDAAKKGLP